MNQRCIKNILSCTETWKKKNRNFIILIRLHLLQSKQWNICPDLLCGTQGERRAFRNVNHFCFTSLEAANDFFLYWFWMNLFITFQLKWITSFNPWGSLQSVDLQEQPNVSLYLCFCAACVRLSEDGIIIRKQTTYEFISMQHKSDNIIFGILSIACVRPHVQHHVDTKRGFFACWKRYWNYIFKLSDSKKVRHAHTHTHLFHSLGRLSSGWKNIGVAAVKVGSLYMGQ